MALGALSKSLYIFLFIFCLVAIVVASVVVCLLYGGEVRDSLLKFQQKVTKFEVSVGSIDRSGKELTVKDFSLRLPDGDVFTAQRIDATLRLRSLLKGVLHLVSAEIDGADLYLALPEKPDPKKSSSMSSYSPFKIENAKIKNSKVRVFKPNLFDLSIDIHRADAKLVTINETLSIDLIADVSHQNIPLQQTAAQITQLKASGDVIYGGPEVWIKKLQGSFPKQNSILVGANFLDLSGEVIGKMHFAKQSDLNFSKVVFSENETTLLEGDVDITFGGGAMEIQTDVKRLRRALISKYVEIPKLLRDFELSSQMIFKMKNGELEKLDANGKFIEISFEDFSGDIPGLNFKGNLTIDNDKIRIDSCGLSIEDQSSMLGGLNLSGEVLKETGTFALGGSILVDDVRKLAESIYQRPLGSNEPFDAQFSMEGTSSDYTFKLKKVSYMDASARGSYVMSEGKQIISLLAERIPALDLYQLTTMDPAAAIKGSVDAFRIDIESVDAPIGFVGDFSLHGVDFVFSDRVSDVFPFNIVFLPFSVLTDVVSAVPMEIVPSGMSGIQNSIDEFQQLQARDVVVQAHLDGDWLHLDKAFFEMSGVTPDVEFPGRLNKEKIRINSGVFLLGNKLPLPIRGSPNSPVPDVGKFVGELGKTVLKAPLNTIKSIGSRLGIFSKEVSNTKQAIQDEMDEKKEEMQIGGTQPEMPQIIQLDQDL